MRFFYKGTYGRVRFVHSAVYHTGVILDRVFSFEPSAGDRRCTICEISFLNKETDEFEGVAGSYAICDSRDHFNKGIGRRRALTHSLEQINDRELRTAIWENYFEQHSDLAIFA